LGDIYSYFFEQKAMSKQSSFVDNDDLGFKIPSAWRVEPLGKSKVLSIVKTGVKDFRGNKRYFATADIDGNDFETTATVIDYSGRESRANMQPLTSSVWIAKMKDTDKTFFLNDQHRKLIDSSIFSTGFFGFQTSNEFLPYLYGFLNSNYFVTKKNFFATGATQEAINQWMLDYIYIPIPDSGLIDEFNEVATPIMNQIAVSQMSIFSYTEAVDTLLPQILNK
jgi:type I restriction enzyme S subunit